MNFVMMVTDFCKSNRNFKEVSTANAPKSYERYANTITNALVCTETIRIEKHNVSGWSNHGN